MTDRKWAPLRLMPSRTISRTFEFSGRSSRTELFVYLVLTSLFLWLLFWAFDWLLPQDSGVWLLYLAIDAVVSLPLVSLLFRRAQDAGFSGWLSLPGVLLWIVSIYDGLINRPMTSWDAWGMPWTLIGLASIIWVVILSLLPPPLGENRFGPDPRLA
ncbi:DUF805 domain-containing protein [Pseudoblastomonas halimionae]|uniref:DUF805 domain-containing protein n=1 Tax=Alteriqipengyuania halimionae TaxID=1926630 RepID=A0A6I4U7L9_9SPHN|nr:DUF805 domain-containing protein [Alteriqipengyuania halimionae]MXP10381.1 DUF805 domain-containing protein [Alteriqipengyuania halimionae]